MKFRLLAMIGALMGAMVLSGCGSDDGVNSPVVKVSEADHKAFEQQKAEKTVVWLEGLPAGDRQQAIDRAPEVKTILKNAQQTDLKSRIDALGLHL